MNKEIENKIKKAYKDILLVCEKYTDESYLADSNFDDVRNMRDKAKNHLMIIDWQEKYGLDLKHDKNFFGYNYINIDGYRHFSYFADAETEKKEGRGRYIFWEDNSKQPKDEWLLCIGFPTGAYIFGDDYPTNIFEEFWQELKSYNPKYCDTTNKSMYFSLENAKEVFNNFREILKKYCEKNIEDAKNRKIKRMEEELSKLKSNS